MILFKRRFDMDINDIIFDERFDDDYNNTTTFYFTAPKRHLKIFFPDEDFPEAVSMEISIEFPSDHIEARYASMICVSPTREDENGTEDYDWRDISLSYDEIENIFYGAGLSI